ncbi:MAG: 16S rRNA (uracil(1498)-N(3))-methyltransferase [Candidatus Eremiobacteraeota bacterium]|nr:16S rRNA (uracil(1498)-N(3))-methyltransferase [Candidatus Eremiobacteraeota bacterium]
MRAPAETTSKRNPFSIASKKRSNQISDRVFVAGTHAVGDRVKIEGGDARKLITVLRRRTGDRIEVIDSAAQRFEAMIEVDRKSVVATLENRVAGADEAAAFSVSVAQAIPKGQKMDFVVEKLTELGAYEILPFYCERTVPRRSEGGRHERWERLAASAARQSGRSRIPAVVAPHDFDTILERFNGYDRVLFLWELAEQQPLHDRLPRLLKGARSILVVVGPEGGFSSEEATLAQQRGAHLTSIGRRIVRTETAALVMLAILNYLA